MELVDRNAMIGQQDDKTAIADRFGAEIERQLCDAAAADRDLALQVNIIGYESWDVFYVGRIAIGGGDTPTRTLPSKSSRPDPCNAAKGCSRSERTMFGDEGRTRCQHLIANTEHAHHQIGIVQRCANAQCDVVSFTDDVHPTIGQFQLKPDLRLGAQEFGENRGKEDVCDAGGATDTQAPRGTLAGVFGNLEGGTCCVRHNFAMGIEGRADISDVHRPGRPLQQSDAQPLLKISNAPAHP